MPTHRPVNPTQPHPSLARPGWTSHIIDFLAAARPQRFGFAFALGVLVALGVAACDHIVATGDKEPDAIALFPASAQVEEGDLFQLQVREASNPGGGSLSGLDLLWESSNPAVASVDNGMVRGLSRGEARISAMTSSGKRAEATVEVARTPAEVELVGASMLEGRVGEELTEPVEMRVLSPRGLPVDGVVVRFSVEDGAGAVSPVEAASDGAGLVTAHWTLGTLAGPQELRVRFPDHSGTPSPMIASALPGDPVTVTVLPDEVKLRLGEAFQFKSQVSDEYGNRVMEVPVRWYTSNEDVIEIEEDGWVSARRSGSATVEAEPLDAAAQSSSASPGKGLGHGLGNVEVEDEEAGSEAQVTIIGGNDQRGPINTELPEELTIRVTDSRGNPVRRFDVTWSVPEGGGWVSDEVTRTDGQGRTSVTMTLGPTAGENEVEGKAGSLGTADFDAMALDEDGTEDVASVTVSPKHAEVNVDETLHLDATARDEDGFVVDGTQLEWTSLDASVATVDEEGFVLGRSVGTVLIVVASVCCEAADTATVDVASAATTEEAPGQVTTLEAVSATEDEVTLRWTQVDDGTGEPAKYAVRYGSPAISWSSAHDTEVSVGGTGIGATLEYAYNGLEPDTEYEFQLVAYRGTLDEDAEFGDRSNKDGTSTDPSAAGESENEEDFADPDRVIDLAAGATTEQSVTLHWTQVDDGTGEPAKYALRYGSPEITWWEQHNTEVSIDGSEIGSTLEYTYDGLTPETGYEFQLVAYRGTLNEDAEFGDLSNKDGATTDPSDSDGSDGGDDGSSDGDDGSEGDGGDDGSSGEDDGSDGDGGDGSDGTGSGAPYVNQPAGMSQLTSRSFESLVADGWSNWTTSDGGTVDLISASGAKFGSQVVRLNMPAGVSNTWTATSSKSFPISREVYIYFRSRVSDNFYGHDNSGINKKFFVVTDGVGGGGDPGVLTYQGSEYGTLRFRGDLQHPGVPNRQFTDRLSDVELVRGHFDEIEVVMRWNSTPSASDGEYHAWVNGVKVLEYTDIQWHNKDDYEGFNKIRLQNVHGGANGSGIPEAQYFEVDHVYVSGRN